MKRLMIVLVLCLWVTLSQAGINEGGVLVVHHDPELVYTAASCDSLVLLSDCSQLNPTAAADGSPRWWFVLAAFADSVPERLNTITFGLGNYNDTDLVIGDWGPCQVIGSPLEIPSDGWPAPNTGTSISWAPDCGGGSLVPVYWFVTYAYGTGTIPLGGYYPGQSSAFVSCGSPPDEDVIGDHGSMGFGVPGQNPCPGESGGDGSSGGEDSGPSFPEDGGSSATYNVKVLGYDSGLPVEGIRIKATANVEELNYYEQPQPPQCEGSPAWVDEDEKYCTTFPPTDEFGEAQCEIPLDPCTCSEDLCWRERLDPSVPWGRPAITSSQSDEWYVVDWENGAGASIEDQIVYVRKALSSQEICACADSAVFYVDPTDNSISFDLFAGSDEPSIELLIKVRDPRSGAVLHQETREVGLAKEAIDDIEWDQASGMARVTLTTLSGQGNTYYFRPRTGQGRDREQFNGNVVAISRATAKYRFWVPHMAHGLRLELLTGSHASGSGTATLRNSQGSVVWGPGSTGDPVPINDIPLTSRGSVWELEIDIQTSHLAGTLEVSFKEKNAGPSDWWTPECAFSPVPSNPIRAEFAPSEIFTLDQPENLQASYYAPFGDRYGVYSEASPLDLQSNMVPIGRQSFIFVADPGVAGHVTVYRLPKDAEDSDAVLVEYQIGVDGSKQREEADPSNPLELSFGGQGSEPVPLFLRIMKGDSYDVTTDAPHAVVGPTPGFQWTRRIWVPSDLETRPYFFYVPPGVNSVGVSLEARRNCYEVRPDGECTSEDYHFRVYPSTELTVTNPAGESETVVADSTNHGKTELTMDVGQWDGHLWKVKVKTLKGWHMGADGSRGGLGVNVVFKDNIPPYFTWLEKERFFLPLTFPVGPLMVHDVDSSFESPFMVVPNTDVYFGEMTRCHIGGSICPVWQPPLGQLMNNPIDPLGNILKQKWYPTFRPWLGPTPLTGRIDTLYAIPRPTGLTVDGRLRTSVRDSAGVEDQFVLLHGSTTAECQSPGDPECSTQLGEAKDRGYRLLSLGSDSEANPQVLDQAHALGLHTQATVGGPWFGDPPEPLTPVHWLSFEQRVSDLAERDGVVWIRVNDEGLEHGIAEDIYYEMIYKARKGDGRHPIIMNNETSIVSMRRMRDLVEILADVEYLSRHSRTTALCELVNKVLEIKDSVPTGRATGIHHLAGFVDGKDGNEKYHKAGPDTVGIQTLGSLLLGVDAIDHYLRFSGFTGGPRVDLADSNARLWAKLPGILSVVDSVRAWSAVNEPYETAFTGTDVLECEEAPFLYGYGRWDAEQYEGRLGTWFAFCNFAQEASQTIDIAWSDLRLPDPGDVENLYVIVDSDSAGRGIELDLVLPGGQESGRLHCSLPGTRWIVGRVVWELNPASVFDAATVQVQRPMLSAYPNPFSARTTVFLSSPREEGIQECSIFTPSGRRVCRLRASENVGRRLAWLAWDGRDAKRHPLPSGCYFLRVKTSSGEALTSRVVILR